MVGLEEFDEILAKGKLILECINLHHTDKM